MVRFYLYKIAKIGKSIDTEIVSRYLGLGEL